MPLQNLERGTFMKGGERLDWTLYDSASLVSTSTTYRFFTNAEGSSATKTQNITNATAGGQIPTNQRLHVNHIKLMYHGAASMIAAQTPEANLKYIYNFIANSVLQIKIPGKDSILTLTLQEMFGTCMLLPLVPTVSFNVPLIEPRFHGIFPLNKKIILSAQTNYFVQVDCYNSSPNAALNGDMLRIGLNGILERRS